MVGEGAVPLLTLVATQLSSLRRTLGVCFVLLASCVSVAPVGQQRLVHADGDTANWLLHGRTYSEQRYSPLATINDQNVRRLGLAWYADFDTRRGQEATPLVVDGVMYVSSSWSWVYALDARTGRKLWSYNPQVPGATAVKACCDVVNRGVAYWHGRVYVGTLDGRLIALDAHTGRPVWSVVTVDQDKPYTITGAPRIVKGRVLIGNGGAEYMVRGYLSAYDAETGRLSWRFYTVPGDPSRPQENPILESAKQTWNGEWWKVGGGGTVWDSMAYDPDLDLLYVGVGNGAPWNRELRSPGGGDNLFLSSIVALRPETGEYVWHYQTTPGDMWDYTATQHIVLADIVIDGLKRQVLMQAPKNGFFYVLDRATGKLISAKAYAPINWASGVDLHTGRPLINPDAFYPTSGKPWLAMPGPLGAHSWHPMSYSPKTGLVYLPSFELGFAYVNDPDFSRKQLAVNLGIDMASTRLPDDTKIKAAIINSAKGHLVAWDPVRQIKVWDVEHPAAWNGGVLSTAGDLVFQGDAAGEFSAYQARSGRKLWSYQAHEGIVAPPIAYRIDGVQYIAVVVGWGGTYPLLTGEIARKSSAAGGYGRLLAFRLDGTAPLPQSGVTDRVLSKPTAQFATAGQIAEGMRTYHRYCSGCHGGNAVSGGVLPDLRMSPVAANSASWSEVVLHGALQANGMVAFGHDLSAADAEAIRSYVIERANVDYSAGGQPQ